MNDELGAAVATPAGAIVDRTETADDSNERTHAGYGDEPVGW